MLFYCGKGKKEGEKGRRRGGVSEEGREEGKPKRQVANLTPLASGIVEGRGEGGKGSDQGIIERGEKSSRAQICFFFPFII